MRFKNDTDKIWHRVSIFIVFFIFITSLFSYLIEHSPLGATVDDSYTTSLLHMNGSNGAICFPDESDKTVSARFSTTINTTTTRIGTGSAYFSGNGNALEMTDSSDLNFDSGDFTIDFWFYPTDESRRALFAWGTSDYTLGLDYAFRGTRNVNAWASSNGTSWDILQSDGGGENSGIGTLSLNLNTWNHIALVRNGDRWMTFINGQKDLDIVRSGSIVHKTQNKRIGLWGNGENSLLGYIDEFRVTKGLARWTANFTPLTNQYSTDTNTSALLHFDGANQSTCFTEETGKLITGRLNVIVDNTTMKFGSGSAKFSGNGADLELANSSDFDFGSGDFTIDFWVYPVNEGRNALFAWGTTDFTLGMDYGYRGTRNVNAWASSNGTSWDILQSDGGGANSGIGTLSLNLNAWNHVALVRNGDRWMTFVNGQKDLDINRSGTLIYKAQNKRIGLWGENSISLTGYIDEFRVTKGLARWTANFTPASDEYLPPSPTLTSTPTDTPTSTPTDTPTDTPTATPTISPTDTTTPTPTDTTTPTPTPTVTPTNSTTPTDTITPTVTASPTNTPTTTPTTTPSNEPSTTPTATVTASPTATQTTAPTITGTASPTPTNTPTVTTSGTDTPLISDSLTPSPTTTSTVSYSVQVKVTDSNNKPVTGAKVTVYSTAKEAYTDIEGIAHFTNIEPGVHTVMVSYNKFSGKQMLNVAGSVKEISLTITVVPQSSWLTLPVIIVLIIFGVITVTLVIFLFKDSKQSTT